MKKRNITRRTALNGMAGAALASYVGANPAGSRALVPILGRPASSPLNILRATMRPAMRGIFSGAHDQRAALLDFVREAAEGGKTIEWGSLDVSLDLVTKMDGARGLVVPSGSRWVMHPDTKIRALPTSSGHYEIINIMDVENVAIEGNGARLIGEREAHTGKAGEWGFGLAIRGARNVRISDLIAEDCWGDGFYIGSGRRKYSQDIVFKGTKSIFARRNGLSLISARGFLCEDHESTRTKGHAPEWGVDIEPNDPREFLEDVTFLRTITKASASIGFGVYLAAYEGSPNPVSIRLVDCVDNGSEIGFSVASAQNIAGRIDLVRPRSDGAATAGVYIRRKAVSGPLVTIQEPVITDWNSSAATSTTAARAAISVFAPADDRGTEALGGVDIIKPDIRLTKGDDQTRVAIFVMDGRTTDPDPLTGVRILDPLDLAGLRVWLGAGSAEFRDQNQVSKQVLPDASMTIGAASTFVHNIINVTKTRNYSLAATQPTGAELVFEVASTAGAGRIVLPTGERFYRDDGSRGRILLSTNRGAKLRIKKANRNEWRIMETSGTWSLNG